MRVTPFVHHLLLTVIVVAATGCRPSGGYHSLTAPYYDWGFINRTTTPLDPCTFEANGRVRDVMAMRNGPAVFSQIGFHEGNRDLPEKVTMRWRAADDSAQVDYEQIVLVAQLIKRPRRFKGKIFLIYTGDRRGWVVASQTYAEQERLRKRGQYILPNLLEISGEIPK